MSEARDNAAELRALARAKARYDQQTEGLAGLSYQDTVFMNGIE